VQFPQFWESWRDPISLLRASGGSNSAAQSTFSPPMSSHSITVSADCKIIHITDFENQESLREILFSPDSQVKEIYGFGVCISLCRIEMPSSVEMIGFFWFPWMPITAETYFFIQQLRGKAQWVCGMRVTLSN
jgi:hypothetical protein